MKLLLFRIWSPDINRRKHESFGRRPISVDEGKVELCDANASLSCRSTGSAALCFVWARLAHDR